MGHTSLIHNRKLDLVTLMIEGYAQITVPRSSCLRSAISGIRRSPTSYCKINGVYHILTSQTVAEFTRYSKLLYVCPVSNQSLTNQPSSVISIRSMRLIKHRHCAPRCTQRNVYARIRCTTYVQDGLNSSVFQFEM